jgi:hypothetical protein
MAKSDRTGWGRAVAARLVSALLAGAVTVAAQAGSVVRLEAQDGQYQLLRNGEPYTVRGACARTHLEQLKAAGGNSTRTWSTDAIGPLLDEAEALGLTVTVGFWLGHERHGFNYADAAAVAAQLERARQAVLQYREHPALLLWAIGNEAEGDGRNPAVWSAINEVARAVRQLDPNHPTMTVIAELGEPKVANLHQYCPEIDLVGINTYGGVGSAVERYRAAGGTKPCTITEFGPPGQWEAAKGAGGAPLELTSTRKAAWYRDAYRDSVAAFPDFCLGSYAFLWGHKQEATATWHGMFLKDGSRLGAVEAMAEAWGSPAPANRCPLIGEVRIEPASGHQAGQPLRATVEAMDPDGDPLRLEWVLRLESGLYGTGGDAQPDQPHFPQAILRAEGSAAEVVPPGGGVFRLFAYAYDGKGNAAVANTPVQVEGEEVRPEAPRPSLPFVVYAEAGGPEPYVPSGYMGNTQAIHLDPACSDRPASGQTCLRVTYSAADGWGGVVWQSPANDWGDQPGGYNLTGASALEFAVRGAQGGETVSFGVGLIAADKAYPDTVRAELPKVRLTAEWQTLTIPLRNRDRYRIKSGFFWSLAGQGVPVNFYLDDIRYVK